MVSGLRGEESIACPSHLSRLRQKPWKICVTPGYPFSRHKIIEVPPPPSANSSPAARRSTQNFLPSASR